MKEIAVTVAILSATGAMLCAARGFWLYETGRKANASDWFLAAMGLGGAGDFIVRRLL